MVHGAADPDTARFVRDQRLGALAQDSSAAAGARSDSGAVARRAGDPHPVPAVIGGRGNTGIRQRGADRTQHRRPHRFAALDALDDRFRIDGTLGKLDLPPAQEGARGTDLPIRRYIHPVHNFRFPVEAP